jgi:hypothetical protein
MSEKEAVNHPSHYGGADNPHEPIVVIEHYKLGFNIGNTVKYLLRAGKKDNILQDLKKASWYLLREIGNIEAEREAERKRGDEPRKTSEPVHDKETCKYIEEEVRPAKDGRFGIDKTRGGARVPPETVLPSVMSFLNNLLQTPGAIPDVAVKVGCNLYTGMLYHLDTVEPHRTILAESVFEIHSRNSVGPYFVRAYVGDIESAFLVSELNNL